jgi:hypothetical protein
MVPRLESFVKLLSKNSISGQKRRKSKNMIETPKRRILFTLSLNEISTEQLGTRAEMRG